jgi:outer membrane protein TolC
MLHLARRHIGRALPLLLLVIPATLAAQTPDTLTLGTLHRRAVSADPRARQATLLRQQTDARRETIRREWLPSVNATASGSYLSDVATVGSLPGIGPVGPLNHQYDAYVTLRQPLLDPTRRARLTLEDERLAESEAALRTTLYAQRAQVNDAFFAALRRRVEQQVLRTAIDDLTARRRMVQLRVDAGSALPGEVLQLDAELLRRGQALDEARTEERVALAQLEQLTGQTLSTAAVLLPPADSGAPVALDRDRPEYTQFDRSRLVLRARETTVSAMDRPRLSLVTRTGYGRPGLNALGRTFDSYLSTGVQVEWTPWNWGATRRERTVLRATHETIATNELAFTRTIERAALADKDRLQTLQRLTAADDSVVALRERILAEARQRYDEGDLTTADYVTRANEHLLATLDRETRRIRVAETRARYLTTIGKELQ